MLKHELPVHSLRKLEKTVAGSRLFWGVPKRNLIAKRFQVQDFGHRFASKPLSYWVMTGSPLELFSTFFGVGRAIFWLCGSFLAPDYRVSETNNCE